MLDFLEILVFNRVIFATIKENKYLKEKMSQPTYPTWEVRPPIKQGFFFEVFNQHCFFLFLGGGGNILKQIEKLKNDNKILVGQAFLESLINLLRNYFDRTVGEQCPLGLSIKS